MIKQYNLSEISIDEILNRQAEDEANVDDLVANIIKNVRQNKDAALIEYALKFDGATLTSLQVSQQEIDNAFNATDAAFIDTLTKAAANIRRFHTAQLHKGFELECGEGYMGQRYTPMQRAGLYVPSGTACYPSTVLMTAIPAQIAGVEEIVMVSPPDKNGNINSTILAAAKIAGVTKIFKIGGAGAIAALAYGTQSVPKVDKIVGPGNIFVATAKRMVYGVVDIDMIAGPSDILVVADDTANAAFVAADMLGQAEHDTLASAVLITTSTRLASATQKQLDLQLACLERKDIASASLARNGKIIIANSLDEAINAANAVAPEHLELCVENPRKVLDKVRNAGSIFLGSYTPEALGDYFAGPNHTLPTNGTARFSSPLSTDDFVKKSSYLYYTKAELAKVYQPVADFATREGLTAHANSATIRFEE